MNEAHSAQTAGKQFSRTVIQLNTVNHENNSPENNWKQDLILPPHAVDYCHYNASCLLGVFRESCVAVLWRRPPGDLFAICVDCGGVKKRKTVSFGLSWPLIKMFSQAWWKRESCFRGDWTTGTAGALVLCESLALLRVSAGGETSSHSPTSSNGNASLWRLRQCPQPLVQAPDLRLSSHRWFMGIRLSSSLPRDSRSMTGDVLCFMLVAVNVVWNKEPNTSMRTSDNLT